MLLILDIGAFAETILIFSFCIKNKFRHNTKQLWKAYALKKIHEILTKLLAPDASMVHILFSQNASSAVRNSKVGHLKYVKNPSPQRSQEASLRSTMPTWPQMPPLEFRVCNTFTSSRYWRQPAPWGTSWQNQGLTPGPMPKEQWHSPGVPVSKRHTSSFVWKTL